MKYEKVHKQARNGIEARIQSAVNKYGFDEFKSVVNKYLYRKNSEARLSEEIHQREIELKELKKKNE